MRDDFVVLILTHGRADNVKTYGALRKHGYTGRIVLVVDNEDEQLQEYYDRYGTDDVFVFDKAEVAKSVDAGDNTGNRCAILFARNACFDIARQLGYKYFIELDDDYVSFSYRHDSRWVFKQRHLFQLDTMFSLMVYFLELDKRIKAVCITQQGDYIGGVNGSYGDIKLYRKAMNSFVCSVDKPFKFAGRFNDDVCTYTTLGGRGDLFFTLPSLCLGQLETQSLQGGMTDVYKEDGTYVKSFYAVMMSPSCVKIAAMGVSDMRIHHNVKWGYAVPKILHEKWKKK